MIVYQEIPGMEAELGPTGVNEAWGSGVGVIGRLDDGDLRRRGPKE